MAAERLVVRKILDILRLKLQLGLSDRQVARSANCSNSTVNGYVGLARKLGLDSWDKVSSPSELEFDSMFFKSPTQNFGSSNPTLRSKRPRIKTGKVEKFCSYLHLYFLRRFLRSNGVYGVCAMGGSMIYTITPNPALDLGGTIGDLLKNEKNYVSNETRFAGGNGINAGRIAHRLGAPVIVSGFLGGSIGEEVRRLLESENVNHNFITISGNTRINLTVSKKKLMSIPPPGVGPGWWDVTK